MKYQFIFSLLLVHQLLFGQTNPEVNLTDYIKEVQIWTKEQNNMSHTLWLPTSYWDLALKDNPSIPDMRTAAYVCAINKVGTSYAELGIFP